MNSPALLLPLVAVLQLALTWASDKALTRTDRSQFLSQLSKRGDDGTGAHEWFTETHTRLGEARTENVLRIASVAAAARGLYVTNLVLVVASFATGSIILGSDDAAFAELRIAAIVVAFVIAVGGLLMLHGNRDDWEVMLSGESELRRGDRSIKKTWALLWLRLRSPHVTTPYLAAAFGSAVLTTAAAAGL